MAHTLLLIDDSQTVRQAASLVLAKDTAFQITFWSGNIDFKPDLIIVSHQNGYDFCLQLRKNSLLSKTPILMLVSSSTQLDARQAVAVGIVGTIQKPFSSDEFLAAVREAIAAPQKIVSTELSFEPPTLDHPPIKAVESMTRQKIEEIVWKIVPQMAEKIIREEIQRLLRPE